MPQLLTMYVKVFGWGQFVQGVIKLEGKIVASTKQTHVD